MYVPFILSSCIPCALFLAVLAKICIRAVGSNIRRCCSNTKAKRKTIEPSADGDGASYRRTDEAMCGAAEYISIMSSTT